MELYNKLKRSRLAVGIMAAGMLLSACDSNTTEGIKTERCVPVEAYFKMSNGDKIYLGDVSSDDLVNEGPQNDWAFIQNSNGQIVTDVESRANTSNGRFTQTESGLKYIEDDVTYHIVIGEPVLGKPLEVAVTTDC